MTEEKTNETKTRSVTKNTRQKMLIESKVMIKSLTEDESALKRISVFNFTLEDMENHLGVIDDILELQNRQQKEQGESLAATKHFEELKEKADYLYSDYVMIARLLLEDNDGAKKMLGLDGRRESRFADYTLQALGFYDNAISNEDLLLIFARRGITKMMLEEGRNAMQAVVDYKAAVDKERSDVLNITDEKDKKIAELEAFIKELKVFAKIAFRDDSSLLKKMGL